MTATRSGRYVHGGHCDNLTTEGTTKCRDAAEALILDAIEQAVKASDGTPGITAWSEDDLTEHNRLISELWSRLDHLSLWAGGRPFYGYTRDSPQAQRRGQVARACLALLAQADPDAEVAEVQVTVRNDDGTIVSYYATPSQNWSRSRPVGRVIHGSSHEGCVNIPPEEA